MQGVYPSDSYAAFKGYYVSTTSLQDSSYPIYDVRRYANAVNLSFVVLPHLTQVSETGVKLGDFVYVYSAKTRKSSFAVYADVGPTSQIGEGSVALHLALGHDPFSHSSSPRVVNGIDGGVLVLVFPGTGDGTLPTQAKVDEAGTRALGAWGGVARVQKCLLLG